MLYHDNKGPTLHVKHWHRKGINETVSGQPTHQYSESHPSIFCYPRFNPVAGDAGAHPGSRPVRGRNTPWNLTSPMQALTFFLSKFLVICEVTSITLNDYISVKVFASRLKLQTVQIKNYD